MKILLLGNGFDLNYGLPTKYIDFLKVIDFLRSNIQYNITTVGSVMGNPRLHNEHPSIKKAMNALKKYMILQIYPWKKYQNCHLWRVQICGLTFC